MNDQEIQDFLLGTETTPGLEPGDVLSNGDVFGVIYEVKPSYVLINWMGESSIPPSYYPFDVFVRLYRDYNFVG